MSEEHSPAELYAISLQYEEPKYYTRVPNILSHLTFIEDGVRKRLSVYARILYTALCEIGAQTGRVWMNRDNLAERCNMSAGSVTNAQRELAKPMEQLNGKPLIMIEKKKKSYEQNGQKQVCFYNHSTVMNIWPEANAYMTTLEKQPRLPIGNIEESKTCGKNQGGSSSEVKPEIVHKSGGKSPHDSASRGPSSHDFGSLGGKSRHDGNKNNRKKNKLCKENRINPPGESCHFSNEFPVIDAGQEARQQSLLKERMRVFGCDESFITEVVRKWSTSRIKAALEYVVHQIARGKQINNRYGYLRGAVEKGLQWN